MLALDHGRDVLCDKPFGRDAAEALAMRDRAVALGVLHFLNFEFRRHPARVKARALIDAGAIGVLRHVGWNHVGSGLRSRPHGWLFDAERGGGWIGAYGSHCIDAIRDFFGGEVADCGAVLGTDITARPDADGTPRPVTAEDAFSAWLMMEDGGSASIDTAGSAPVGLPQHVVLRGSEGIIEIVDDRVLTLRRADGGVQELRFDPGADTTLQLPLATWLAELRDATTLRRQIGPSFEDGLRVSRIMDRMRGRAP